MEINRLTAHLDSEMKKYDNALDTNAGFDTRKGIRIEIRRIQDEIITLKKINRNQAPRNP